MRAGEPWANLSRGVTIGIATTLGVLAVFFVLLYAIDAANHNVTATTPPLTDREAIAVWCAVHDGDPGPPTQAWLRTCTRINTP